MSRLHRQLINVLASAAVVWCLAAAHAAAQPVNLLINGGFESPALAADSILNITPPAALPGWSISAGDVDVVRLPLPSQSITFGAFEGDQVLDLHGLARGTIAQQFATTPGLQYVFNMRLSDNPNATGVASAQVDIHATPGGASLLSGSIAHSSATPSNANFTSFGGTFTAQTATTLLTIASTSANAGASGGLLLDAISVTVVPEPAGLAIATGAAIAIAGIRRRVK